MPALQEARKKAKYARWLGYSNNLRCEPNLVAYYNFEEGEGNKLENKAVGPYGNTSYAPEKLNGTISSAAWATDAGRWTGKGALEFDGNDDLVSVNDNASLEDMTALTLETWFKINDLSSRNAVVDKDMIYKIDVLATTGYVRFLTGDGSSWGTILTTNTQLKAGKWYHLVATYDSATKKVFINQAQDSNTTSTAENIGTNTKGLTISRAANVFNGTIDEVAIYNRALTADEIEQHYKMGKL